MRSASFTNWSQLVVNGHRSFRFSRCCPVIRWRKPYSAEIIGGRLLGSREGFENVFLTLLENITGSSPLTFSYPWIFPWRCPRNSPTRSEPLMSWLPHVNPFWCRHQFHRKLPSRYLLDEPEVDVIFPISLNFSKKFKSPIPFSPARVLTTGRRKMIDLICQKLNLKGRRRPCCLGPYPKVHLDPCFGCGWTRWS